MAELFAMLQIDHIKTSPYHSQTDGMVERFNGTLKYMLRKCYTDKWEWDDVLPYLLFAYREAPHASTGFSPFELLHGQHMRGPLKLMYEDWTARKRSPVCSLICIRSATEAPGHGRTGTPD